MLNRTVPLGNVYQAVSIAHLLLKSFGPKALTQGQSSAKSRDFVLRQNLPWVLNGYDRLRRVVVQWTQRTEPALAQSEEQIILAFLASMHHLCVRQFSVPAPLSEMSLTTTWIHCLGELIHPSITCQSSTLQAALSDYLDEVVQWSRQFKSSVQPLRETFFPILREFDIQGLNMRSVDSCLWVKTVPSCRIKYGKADSKQQSLQSLADGLLHTPLPATRPSGSPTMQPGTELLTASQRQGMIGDNHESIKRLRPPKRLCLPAAHTDKDPLQTLINHLSALLDSDCSGSLIDLRSALE